MIDPYALGLHVSRIVGVEARCRCPYHNDNHPSASFNMEKGLFHCFGCGTNATAKQLLMVLGGEYVDDGRAIKSQARVEDREWRHYLTAPLAFGDHYLASRGVSEDQIAYFGIRRTPTKVIFPLFDQAGICGALTREKEDDVKPKYVVYGHRPALWPWRGNILNVKRPYVVEGVFAALNMTRTGFPSFATFGTGAINSALQALRGRIPQAVMDEDFPGHVAAAKIALATGTPMMLRDQRFLEDIDTFEPNDLHNMFETAKYTYHLREFAERSDDPKKLISLVMKWKRQQ